MIGRLPNSFRPALCRAGGVWKEGDGNTRLDLRFDGPEIASGIEVDDLWRTVRRLREALRLLLEQDAERIPREGRETGWAKRESAMRVGAPAPGSLLVPLSVGPAGGGSPEWRDFREAAIARLLDRDDLPRVVEGELEAIAVGLSEAVTSVRLGDPASGRGWELRRRTREVAETEVAEGDEIAILDGWLREVNWAEGTAQLHDYYGERIVRLRFEPALADAITRRANDFALIRGRGAFDADGGWKVVQVQEVRGPRSYREPFDLEAALKNPNPKIFDPEAMVPCSEPFDLDEFLRIVREDRDR